MPKELKKTLLSIIHTLDLTRYDFAHVIALWAVLDYLGISSYMAIVKNQWNPEAFGIGFASLVTSVGIMLGFKARKDYLKAKCKELIEKAQEAVSGNSSSDSE